ncbi:MAG: DegT/DnrJ/EryC1/StrS family aminotransferase [Thermodesulfobacteriota bacterium]|nr:DegT/DnrJ/EryC1/StrS family aminotransferase [Thermodesulfobacteriota bacterium]
MNKQNMQIKFFDFSCEIAEVGDQILDAVKKVIHSGRYILDNEVTAFEKEFAKACACKYAIGVASGTDALFLALKALDIGPGDEVITVANTFAATALSIMYTGATPVFIDIEPRSYLMDPTLIQEAITPNTKAILPVHLYGACANMDKIMEIAAGRNLFVLEDACQAHGALYKNRPAGGMGHLSAFSFYPTKNLGAYGDGGMIITNDTELFKKLTLLRNYGQKDRYTYHIPGYNSRLDEMQAAILRVKLKYLFNWVERRQKIAALYDIGLKDINLVHASMDKTSTHAYHLYVISVEKRDELQVHLKDNGVETLIHYPVLLHKQKAFKKVKVFGQLKHAELRSNQILSLPIHPWLTDDEVHYIIDCVKDFYS